MVRGITNAELFGDWVIGDPAPAASLDSHSLGAEPFLEVFETSKGFFYSLCELRGIVGDGTTFSASWGKVVPEEGVVKVAPGIEGEPLHESTHLLQFTASLGVEELLNKVVVVVNVGLVMLAVVDLHQLG